MHNYQDPSDFLQFVQNCLKTLLHLHETVQVYHPFHITVTGNHTFQNTFGAKYPLIN